MQAKMKRRIQSHNISLMACLLNAVTEGQYYAHEKRDRTLAFLRKLVCRITQIKKLKDSTEAPKKGKLTDAAPVYHFFLVKRG